MEIGLIKIELDDTVAGKGPDHARQVCRGMAGSVWIFDFVRGRPFHNRRPGDF